MTSLGRWVLGLTAVGALLVAPMPAAATVIFFDDFEAAGMSPPVLNTAPVGWTVTDGTVDLVGSFPGGSGSPFAGLCVGSPTPGTCVDLDGSTNDAGTLSQTLLNVAAGSYLVSFWAQGNARGAADDTMNVYFGTDFITLTLQSGDPWKYYSFLVDNATLQNLSPLVRARWRRQPGHPDRQRAGGSGARAGHSVAPRQRADWPRAAAPAPQLVDCVSSRLAQEGRNEAQAGGSAGDLGLGAASRLEADTVRGLAIGNSSNIPADFGAVTVGNGLDTGITVTTGQTLSVTAAEDDCWSAGDAPRTSNANGLLGSTTGCGFGGDFGTLHEVGGFGAPFGSLVGLIGGQYYLLGTNYLNTVTSSRRPVPLLLGHLHRRQLRLDHRERRGGA